jgi:hypothetical protein
MRYMEAADSIVQAVVTSFLQRAAFGHKKYGTTLDRTDLKPLDWIQHAQEELMDGILYLEKLKKEIKPVAPPSTSSLAAQTSSMPGDYPAAASPPNPSPE